MHAYVYMYACVCVCVYEDMYIYTIYINRRPPRSIHCIRVHQ